MPKDPSALDRYLQEIRRTPALPHEEEERLCRAYSESRDPQIARKLANQHLLLVIKIAYEYPSDEDRRMDLIQEGNLGLLRAVELYDPNRGVKLSSYAAWWIRAYMLRDIMANVRLVKVGTTQAQRRLFWMLNKERAAAEAQSIEPGELDRIIAERTGHSEEQVASMRTRMEWNEVSISGRAPSSTKNDGWTWGDMLPDSAPAPDSAVEDQNLRGALRERVRAFEETLEGRVLDIFQARLKGETVRSIGKRHNLSYERIRQIDAKTRQRLRAYLAISLGSAVPEVPLVDLQAERRRVQRSTETPCQSMQGAA